MSRILPAIFITLASSHTAVAHEFWIEPETFRPAPGSVTRVGLRIGDRFLGEPVTFDPALIDQFMTFGPAGERAVIGQPGKQTGLIRIETSGLYLIGYRSNRCYNELPAEKFERYLRGEGLAHIVPLRAQRGESKRPGREVYSRCAKSLLATDAGATDAKGYDRELGFTLELVPEKNPYTIKPGHSLPVRLMYNGAPLSGARIVVVNRVEPENMRSVHTDDKGRLAVRLPKTGVWMLTSIHMVRAPSGVDAEWESLWASLTFEVPERIDE